MTEDLTPYLGGLAPDPAGVQSARTYADFSRPDPLQRLEEFVMSLTLFYKDKAGPGLSAGLSEAVHTFFFAASGFFAILEDTRPTGPGQDMRTAAEWKALSCGLAWARSQRTEAGQSLSLEEKDALSRALINPHMLPLLPTWAGQMTAAGKARQGARFAVWGALVYLLEAAPFLEDGETEGLLCELLEAFAQADTPTA